MCDPVSIGMAALSIGSTLYATDQQNKAAAKYNKQLENSYNAQINGLQEQRQQMGQQQQQEESEIAKQARAEAARIAVIAGESGAMGGVYDRLMSENKFARDGAITQSRNNLDNQMVQSQREAESMRYQTMAGAKSGQSWSGVGLQIAGQALDAYSKSRAAKDPRLNPTTK